ncbi:hypothetical protein NUSPORA_02544 [Nucleospora cyclopteri]
MESVRKNPEVPSIANVYENFYFTSISTQTVIFEKKNDFIKLIKNLDCNKKNNENNYYYFVEGIKCNLGNGYIDFFYFMEYFFTIKRIENNEIMREFLLFLVEEKFEPVKELLYSWKLFETIYYSSKTLDSFFLRLLKAIKEMDVNFLELCMETISYKKTIKITNEKYLYWSQLFVNKHNFIFKDRINILID